MAFKEVLDLNPDTVIALGGQNRKTGKANPTKVEGYYLGKRQVEDRKKKSGVSYIYVFQTEKGNVGVWGKTDLDRKMQSATPGAMLRATCIGTTPTPNGDMYKFKVEVDSDNTIEVTASEEVIDSGFGEDTSPSPAFSNFEEDEEDEFAGQEVEAPVSSPVAALKSTGSMNKVQDLLNRAKQNKAR